jgi:hypothetical protein
LNGDGWLARFVQFFGPLLAAWSAFLAFLVHLKKIRNAEKSADWDRYMRELDRVTSERDVVSEERDMVRDRNADLEREKAELLGRAVIAESKLIVADQAAGRPSILPGADEHKGNGA